MIFLTDHISLEHQVNTMKKWHICSRFDKTIEIFRGGKEEKTDFTFTAILSFILLAHETGSLVIHVVKDGCSSSLMRY